MKKQNWVWMPHPGHFICSSWCKFVLNTYVGGYIVSTVGEYLPDAPIREILAQSRKVQLTEKGDDRIAEYKKKIGFEELGVGRFYETMVFRAKKSRDGCCPFSASDFSNLDGNGYKTAEEAYKGHMKLCAKWAKKPSKPKK